jgi:tRNA (guanine-N7-)-methyltransferase
MVQQTRRRLVYGRRQGHKLRGRQAGLMETLLPSLRISCSCAGDLDPQTLFDFPVKEVWLEIGFGGAEHLLEQARAHPEIGFIGCEPFINGVAKLLAGIETHGLRNIRVHDGDARDVLESLESRSLGRMFLLFPDPWHKKRHNKRRFVSNENLDQMARLLKPGGVLRIASDIPDYIRWTLVHIYAHGGFTWQARMARDWRFRPADWPATRYEAKALRQGRRPSYLTFLRR